MHVHWAWLGPLLIPLVYSAAGHRRVKAVTHNHIVLSYVGIQTASLSNSSHVWQTCTLWLWLDSKLRSAQLLVLGIMRLCFRTENVKVLVREGDFKGVSFVNVTVFSPLLFCFSFPSLFSSAVRVPRKKKKHKRWGQLLWHLQEDSTNPINTCK